MQINTLRNYTITIRLTCLTRNTYVCCTVHENYSNVSDMFDIPKKWCPGYKEVGGPHQVPHLPQCPCPGPPHPPPSSRLLHHWCGHEISPFRGVTNCKTCKQNFTLVHYSNKLNVKRVEIKCTVQYTCNFSFMSNVLNTYHESHKFLVSGGALAV